VKADITKPNEVEKLFHNSIEKYNKIDVILNNAGVFPTKKTLNEIDIEQ
jgi:NADP-dependent 3-hydroxy acid dehydrogenase YdfG